MKQTSRTWLAALAALSFATCGAAYAQAPSADAAKSSAMSSAMSKLSTEEKETMKKCKAMSHDAMAADAKCKALKEAHPDLAKDKMSSAAKPK